MNQTHLSMIQGSRRAFLGMFCLWLMVGFASAATVQVSISGVSFHPKVVVVNVGDTVVWSGGADVHTVSPSSGVPEPFCGGFSIVSCSHLFTNAGSFAYHCNFHENSHSMTGLVVVVEAPGGNLPPSITITNPWDGGLFAAPATVTAGVAASDSDGNVISVEWLTNGISSVVTTTAPFGLSLSNLGAGNYTLRARATDNQSLSATSAPVSLRIVVPPTLVFEPATNGPMQFSFNTVAGVNYVVEGATEVTGFSSLTTNAGSGTVQQFTPTNEVPAQKFFRLRLE